MWFRIELSLSEIWLYIQFNWFNNLDYINDELGENRNMYSWNNSYWIENAKTIHNDKFHLIRHNYMKPNRGKEYLTANDKNLWIISLVNLNIPHPTGKDTNGARRCKIYSHIPFNPCICIGYFLIMSTKR